jgi:PadR family transcriptional regulator, regulatory protein PadR
VTPTTRPLGELEQLILLAVLQVGEDAYATPILDVLRQRARRPTSRGALYTVLDRLEQKGLVSSWLGEPLAERGGRPRRHVQVTAAGLSALREARRTLFELWQGLGGVLGGS